MCSISHNCFSQQWNHPHPVINKINKTSKTKKIKQIIRHSAFSESPKTLDPAKAYSSNEIMFLAQIYEPPLQYHYLKRPYTLEPLTLERMPVIHYLDKNHKQLPQNVNTKKIAYTVYDMTIKPGIYYQPHPAFAKDASGRYRYLHLQPKDINKIRKLSDFKYSGTRELKAADYVYEIKRLADPKLHSPIFSFMQNYIVGFQSFNQTLAKVRSKRTGDYFLDLRHFHLKGVKILGPYRYQITIKSFYRQFPYWLSMTFFAPIPWEADAFYSQPDMDEHNISFNWYPIGTGPYQLTENNPNRQMVLAKNPNFHQEYYPTEGSLADKQRGLLASAGLALPFIDKYIFHLDKESIPRWNKFLQGYYDKSAISSDSFDQAVRLNKDGTLQLTPELKQKNIALTTTVAPSVYYFSFNMLDPIVGGYGKKAQMLRQAIAITINYEEYITIFLNGRGIPAHGPIPPGIEGYQKGQEGINSALYSWKNNKAVRKNIAEARILLKKAGYPHGINPQTGKPLILNYDTVTSGDPNEKANLNWMRKQFAKLGITLQIRPTQYNRFQEKVRTGSVQMFSWGWNADYPDPENFLFLLYGPNSKVKHGGENASNYNNPQFDKLFIQIRDLPAGKQRQQLIQKALAVIRKDSPWIWGFHPIQFTLSHAWNGINKAHAMANNTLKYEKVDATLRDKHQQRWNRPITWPLWLFITIFITIVVPLLISFIRKQNKTNIQRYDK